MVASSSPKGALQSGAAGGRGSGRAGAGASEPSPAPPSLHVRPAVHCSRCFLAFLLPRVVLGREPFVSRAGCRWSLPTSSLSFFIKSTCTWPSLCAHNLNCCAAPPPFPLRHSSPPVAPPVHPPCPRLGLAFPHHSSLGPYFPLVSVFMHVCENPWVGPRAREPVWPSPCPLGHLAPCTH